MLKHKRPIDDAIPRFLTDAISTYLINKKLPVLDLACGYGRNSKYLAELGLKVVSADFDADVFKTNWHEKHNCLNPVILNAKKSLPFAAEAFGALIAFDFYIPDLFSSISEYVCSNGLIIYKSYTARGENWRELPRVNEARLALSNDFDFLKYEEKRVGPGGENVTLKFIAKKH